MHAIHNLDENSITQAVLDSQSEATSARLKEVMACLVQHLHDFARETRLTESEWGTAIQFLTDVGHMCSDKRQEFILLSDTLGLSTLVTSQNHRKPPGCTEATVLGPFHVSDAPHYALGADISNAMKGEPCFVSGTVTGLDGQAVPDATLEVWQADADGLYDIQNPDLKDYQGRGVLHADSKGHFHFKSTLAQSYPVPHDGPVGKLLEALGRHPWRPAHLHFMITAPGYERLVTHVFRAGGDYLDSDVVFGVKSSLIADWIRHDAGIGPDGKTYEQAFYTLNFNFVLNRA